MNGKKIKCNHCLNFETEDNCKSQVECDDGVTMCVVAKGVETGGQVKYKKGCFSFAHDCDDVQSLCGRPGSSITCLAGGCCNGSLCVPKKLKMLPLPSSSVKPSSSEAKTSSAKQMATKSSDVLASPAMHSSAPQTTTAEAAIAEATTTTKTTAIKTTMMASSNEVIARATETSMKGMMGSPTVKSSVKISKSPTQGNTRPTCKDCSGMRHVLSPLAIVFVAARLVNLLL